MNIASEWKCLLIVKHGTKRRQNVIDVFTYGMESELFGIDSFKEVNVIVIKVNEVIFLSTEFYKIFLDGRWI